MIFFNKIKIFFNKKYKLSYTKFIFFISTFNFILYLYPLFKRIWKLYHNFFYFIPFFSFYFLTILFILSLFICKKSYKYLLYIILIINSLIFYHIIVYKIVFDVNMLINVTETNFNEAKEFINIKLFLFVIFLGILPSYLILKFIDIDFQYYCKQKIILILTPIFITLISILPCYFFKKAKSFLQDNERITSYMIPTNYVMAFAEYTEFKIHNLWVNKHLIRISDDAEMTKIQKSEKKNLLVFMIGESARAQNFSLNDYYRNTNEFLDEYKKDIIFFKNFESCDTFTSRALTCTFSHLPNKEFNYKDSFKYESLVDIFNKLGFDIYWRSNNGKCKNICNRVENSLVKSFGEDSYDDLLLKVFNKDVKKLNSINNIIFLHGRGSHGPLYYERYPIEFEKWKPACHKDLIECSNEEIVNAYDNTIYYTSFIIKEIFEELKKYENEYNIAFIYMSDHGESLGENGFYVHSYPFDSAPIEQKSPAFFMWFSNDFINEFDIDFNCLKNKSKNNYSEDNIFHSMIGLFKIKSKYYNPQLDIFNNCFFIK